LLVAQLEDADDDFLACGERKSGRRLCSTRPVYPSLRKRRSHLWPVCRENTYSGQSAEMFAPVALLFPGHATVEKPKLSAMSWYIIQDHDAGRMGRLCGSGNAGGG